MMSGHTKCTATSGGAREPRLSANPRKTKIAPKDCYRGISGAKFIAAFEHETSSEYVINPGSSLDIAAEIAFKKGSLNAETANPLKRRGKIGFCVRPVCELIRINPK